VGDGWADINEEKKELGDDEILDLDDDEAQAHVVPDAGGDDEEVFDLDDIEAEADNIFASDKFVSKDANENLAGIAINPKLRKYDLSITYDYFH